MFKLHLQYMEFDSFFKSPITEIVFNEYLKYISGEEAGSANLPTHMKNRKLH